jgi:hypothetical protein
MQCVSISGLSSKPPLPSTTDRAPKRMARVPLTYGFDAADAACRIAQKAARGGAVEERHALLLGHRGQSLHQRKATAHRRDSSSACGDEIAHRKIEAYAEALEPPQGRSGAFGEGRDQFRVSEIEHLDDQKPVLVVACASRTSSGSR